MGALITQGKADWCLRCRSAFGINVTLDWTNLPRLLITMLKNRGFTRS